MQYDFFGLHEILLCYTLEQKWQLLLYVLNVVLNYTLQYLMQYIDFFLLV